MVEPLKNRKQDFVQRRLKYIAESYTEFLQLKIKPKKTNHHKNLPTTPNTFFMSGTYIANRTTTAFSVKVTRIWQIHDSGRWEKNTINTAFLAYTKTNIVWVNTYIHTHTYFLILSPFHNLKNYIIPDVKEHFKNQNARLVIV